jgi:hypothetical protein
VGGGGLFRLRNVTIVGFYFIIIIIIIIIIIT